MRTRLPKSMQLFSLGILLGLIVTSSACLSISRIPVSHITLNLPRSGYLAQSAHHELLQALRTLCSESSQDSCNYVSKDDAHERLPRSVFKTVNDTTEERMDNTPVEHAVNHRGPERDGSEPTLQSISDGGPWQPPRSNWTSTLVVQQSTRASVPQGFRVLWKIDGVRSKHQTILPLHASGSRYTSNSRNNFRHVHELLWILKAMRNLRVISEHGHHEILPDDTQLVIYVHGNRRLDHKIISLVHRLAELKSVCNSINVTIVLKEKLSSETARSRIIAPKPRIQICYLGVCRVAGYTDSRSLPSLGNLLQFSSGCSVTAKPTDSISTVKWQSKPRSGMITFVSLNTVVSKSAEELARQFSRYRKDLGYLVLCGDPHSGAEDMPRSHAGIGSSQQGTDSSTLDEDPPNATTNAWREAFDGSGLGTRPESMKHLFWKECALLATESSKTEESGDMQESRAVGGAALTYVYRAESWEPKIYKKLLSVEHVVADMKEGVLDARHDIGHRLLPLDTGSSNRLLADSAELSEFLLRGQHTVLFVLRVTELAQGGHHYAHQKRELYNRFVSLLSINEQNLSMICILSPNDRADFEPGTLYIINENLQDLPGDSDLIIQSKLLKILDDTPEEFKQAIPQKIEKLSLADIYPRLTIHSYIDEIHADL
jgi:hypothetical protein